MFSAQSGRIDALIVQRVLEQTVHMNARLVGEHALADQALLPGQWSPRSRRDVMGKRREVTQIHIDVEIVELLQTHHDFFERRIARALTEAVHGRIDMRRARHGRGQGVGSGQAEVIVRMHLDFEIDARPQLADAIQNAKGLHDADGIGKAKTIGTGLLRPLDHLQQKGIIGTRGILTAYPHRQPHVAGTAHHGVDGG